MKRPVAPLLIAIAGGIVFGFGLAIAQMTNPQKIKDFLDIASIPSGGWDPSLAFVMGGGVLVAIGGLRLDRWFRTPLAAPAFVRLRQGKIDRRLVVGSGIFGIGWGLAGLCPGPAIANLGLVPAAVLPFVAAMLAGSWFTGQAMEWSARGRIAIDAAE